MLRRLVALSFVLACSADVGHLSTISRAALERPIALARGIGVAGQPVSTASADAQRFYDQGLAYLGSFDWVRSARSFHECLRRDPRLAAAHLGLARAYLGLEAPREAQRQARAAARLAETAELPAREREWIGLGELQMAAVAAWSRGSTREHVVYKQALERYVDRYPDDVHARILRGNADPRPDGWGQAGGEGAIPWYAEAVELDGDHFPAHHFLAHALENVGRHREAGQHAERYAHLAPAVPHAHHMLAHVAPRLGRWEEALENLERADRLHRESFAAGDLTPREDWHFGHNLRLLAAVHLRLGHEARAEELYLATFQLDYGGRRAGFYCLPWIEYLASRERFGEALSAAESCEQRDSELARLLGAALRGEALLALGRPAEARQALAQARERLERFVASMTTASSEKTFAFVAAMAVRTLEGKLALAGPHPAEGEALLLDVAWKLGAGNSFDAWALGLLRIEEIARHAGRTGFPELAGRMGVSFGRRSTRAPS